MSEDKKIKHCVGAIIYTLEGKILLITSKKWNNGNVWLVPGGQMEAGETEEETLRREIREELNLELNTITKCGVCSVGFGSSRRRPISD
jgi:ADP-ribose pyrophosphatase YjhB (NUDIX family)